MRCLNSKHGVPSEHLQKKYLRMKKILILAIIISLLGAVANGQDTINATSDGPEIKPSLGIYTVPSTILDRNPRIRAGAIWFPRAGQTQLGYSLDLGIGFDALDEFIYESIGTTKYVLVDIRPEIRYLFFPQTSSPYLALEYFYIHHTEHRSDGYFHDFEVLTKTYFYDADFKRIKHGYHIKLGYASFISEMVYLDMYIGIGRAFRKINFSNVNIEKEVEFYAPFLNDKWRDHILGHDVFYNMALGLKIGFKIK